MGFVMSQFSKNISSFVIAEIAAASRSRKMGNIQIEFRHLENAHVLGQESTYWHVVVHIKMLRWSLRNRKIKELFGQLFRVIGAATKTAAGLVPRGNTGGTNVSPFKVMPIGDEHQLIICNAKKA